VKITTYDTTRFFGPVQGLSDNDSGKKRLLNWHLFRFLSYKDSGTTKRLEIDEKENKRNEVSKPPKSTYQELALEA
jgi:hypothetical protein